MNRFRKSRSKSLGWAAVLAASSALTGVPALAQTDSADGYKLQEVIVTAQKRAESLQSVPAAVSAFTMEQFDRPAAADIQTLTGSVPTMTIQRNTGSAASIYIRGIGTQDSEKTFDPPVGVVVDGVYVGFTTGQLLQSFDFERVEVLRGPQGTLFGKNTTAGVVSVTRSVPAGDTVNGKASVTLGRFDQRDFKGIVNVPLIKDRLWLKLAGFSERDDGFMKNINNPNKRGAKDYQAFSGALRARPTDDLELVLTYDRVNDKSDPLPFVTKLSPVAVPLGVITPTGPLFNGPDIPCVRFGYCGSIGGSLKDRVSVAATNQYNRNTLDAVTLNGTWNVGSYDLVSVTGWREGEDKSITDFGAQPELVLLANRPGTTKQFTQELRIVSPSDRRLKYVAGLFYFNSEFTQGADSALAAAFFGAAIPRSQLSYSAKRSGQKSQSAAAFAQVDYNLTDELKLSVGGRYTRDHKRYTVQNLSVTGLMFNNEAPLGAPISGSKTWNTFIPRVSLDYKFTPDISAYVLFSRGYNAGGFNQGTTLATIAPFDKEIVDDYEVGLKSELFDNHLRMNLTAYTTKYKNKQQSINFADPNFGQIALVRNVAAQTIGGFEAELTAAPTRNLSLSASFGYLDAKFDSFTASLRTGAPVTNNDNLTPVRAPKYTVSGEATYTVPVGDNNLSFTGRIRHVDKYYVEVLNDPRSLVKPYSLVDLSVSYGFDVGGNALKLTGFVNNATNATYFQGFVTASNALAYAVPTAPRTYGVELQVKF